jgi:pimeloyl-ACP methyl ester carboxylesterase
VLLAAVALVTTLTVASPAAAGGGHATASGPKPTIVLVHGAWADSSSWTQVIARLTGDGYPVLAAPNPLRGPAQDAAYVAAFVAERTTGPVVLVGHSYGGTVITNAATGDPDVKALVFVNAFAPDAGESVIGLLSSVGPVDTSVFDAVHYPGAPDGDVDLYLKKEAYTGAFADDLPRTTALGLAATQRPITLSALSAPSGTPAWRTIPSWYLVGTADHIIAPALQRTMADRADSTVVSVRASHASPVSRPGAVADLIVRAARGR